MGYVEHLKAMGYQVEQPMSGKISEWWAWYTATHDWYSSLEQSAADRRTYKVDRISIKPARMVCQEWASLMMNERTIVSTEDEAANSWLETYLGRSGFLSSGQRLVERAFALGTAAWALRVTGMAEGAALSPGARIVAQRFDARQIVPLSYDEDSCAECAFVSQVVAHGRRLTQLQSHLLSGDGTYRIETALFDDKGRPVEVPGIVPVFETRSAAPLFSLVRPGLENTHCDYSPSGVSVFDDAIGAVMLTDEAVDNMHRDIWLGQKMLFLDERMLQTDASGNVTVPRARDQQLFRKTEVDAGNDLIEEYNPDLRVTDNRLALRTGLQLLGSRCGMGADYFDIEGASSVKTATEVISEQSDLFRNLRKHENALEPAIRTIVAGILTLARTVTGAPLPEDPGGITVRFDDSIIEDAEAQRRRDLTDIAAGLMRPWEYRRKWYGEDEATARAMTEAEGSPAPEF